MLKITYLCLLSWTSYLVSGNNMIGPGKWRMLKAEKKSSSLDRFEFDIVQRKYNRTHDMFQGVFNFHEDLTDKYGARVDVCKFVDGGCKQYQVISDDSFGSLVGKYAAGNFKDMLNLAGLDGSGLPVPMGKYEIAEYLWDWDSMPEEGPWGHYVATACVMEATVEVGCLVTEILFEKTEEEEDDEE